MISSIESATSLLNAAKSQTSFISFSYTQWGTRAEITVDGAAGTIDPVVATELVKSRFQPCATQGTFLTSGSAVDERFVSRY